MSLDNKPLYTLIPLDDFKAVLSIDDREDKLARFCLITATHSIEQYCKRRLLRKKYFERIEYTDGYVLYLKEYPVTKVLAIFALPRIGGDTEIVEPDFYCVMPDYSLENDETYKILFSPSIKKYSSLVAFKVVYIAGYPTGKVPPDLASACMELAAWNMNRYKGRRIGITGNVRGAGTQGEHLELSMPENVKALLEPYKRKVI